jgi:CRISPR system Cascade subunit CasB
MIELISKLEEWAAKESKVRAVLRRSLAFDPGTYPPAYPYVEWLLRDEENTWRREVYYLVAGLWAAHWREGRAGEAISLGKACALLRSGPNGSENIERRFVSLLDADPDQLPHRLRQMLAMVKEYNLDFEALLKGLLFWNDDQKRTQNRWAREFYRNIPLGTETEAHVNEEETT